MLLTYHVILNKALILTGSSIFLSEVISSASQAAQWVKNLLANAGDVGSMLGLRRSPGGRNDNTLQYSCLENSMDWAPGRLQSRVLQRVRHDWSQHSYSYMQNVYLVPWVEERISIYWAYIMCQARNFISIYCFIESLYKPWKFRISIYISNCKEEEWGRSQFELASFFLSEVHVLVLSCSTRMSPCKTMLKALPERLSPAWTHISFCLWWVSSQNHEQASRNQSG